MKLKPFHLIFILFLFLTSSIRAQTKYTFSGMGNWSDTNNWSPSYPGNNLNSTDTIIIDSSASIYIDTSIRVYGILYNYGAFVTDSLNVTDSFKDIDIEYPGNFVNHGTVENYSFIRVYNYLENSSNGTFINHSNGKVVLFPCVSFASCAYFINSGNLTNFGIIGLNGSLPNYGIITNKNFGTIGLSEIGRIVNLEILINEGSIDNLGTLDNNGTITGTNVNHTGDFINLGNLSPGSSTGTYTISDNYKHENSANLQIEIGSSTNYDKVFIDSSAILNGSLNVSLINGFTPNIGDTFNILNAGSVIGSFTNVNLPSNLPTNSQWMVNYSSTKVSLEVISTLTTTEFETSTLKLYPNPAKEKLVIDLGKTSTLIYVRIFNTSGQLILSSKKTDINTFNLGSGTYIVEILTDQGKTNKIIIKE